MRTRTLVNRRSLWLSIGVALLVLSQVIWWVLVFVREVDEKEKTQLENFELRQKTGMTISQGADQISKEAVHRRFMFISESAFFMLLTCTGMYVLFRARKNEARGRETQRSFIEIVSHESKTPLTALKLRLESLVEKKRDDPLVVTEITAARDEVRRLSSLVEKALNLNRLELAQFRFEPIDASELVREVVYRMDPVIRERKVQVRLNLSSEALVKGDSDGLRNALQSLLENAVVYNDKKEQERWVQLSVTLSAQKVKLRVSDNGPGIDPADRERVFERFYRGKAGARAPGSGLGLYIAHTIVTAHQGVLSLVKADSTGTEFEIELPRMPTA